MKPLTCATCDAPVVIPSWLCVTRGDGRSQFDGIELACPNGHVHDYDCVQTAEGTFAPDERNEP